MISLFEINPALDIAALAAQFARDSRVQIRDVLTADAARNLAAMLARETLWGLSWQAAADGPHYERRTAHTPNANATPADPARMQRQLMAAMAGEDYGFAFASYPMLDAYLGKWDAGGPHDIVLEHINAAPFLDLLRTVTAMPDLVKADAQATLYAPGHFLAQHDDSHVMEGWRIAYVLNLCPIEWRPDWGGYLNFLDDDGDIVAGYRPRFNALNLFAVPQRHQVTYVPPFAPAARIAITGWARDR